MLPPQSQLRKVLIAAGFVAALGMDTGFAAEESKVPAPAGTVIDTGISLKAPAPEEAFAPKQEASEADKNPASPAKSAIPEPAAAALGLLGLGLIVFRRYRV